MRDVILSPLSVYPRAELWRAVSEINGASLEEFELAFEFVGLCDDGAFCPFAARHKYDALESAWVGRRVVILGALVLGVLYLQRPSSGLIWQSCGGWTWCSLPPPFYTYDDPLIRRTVGLRLEELMECQAQ